MGKKYSFTTEEERQKIKTLYDMGVSTKEIVRITGRSDHIVNDIVTGKYEARKEADRLRKRGEREAALKAKQQKEIINALDTEERKRQETRERIREEALKAGAPTFDEDDGIPVQAKILPASPFSYDNLLRRVADSTDYTNALLNGVLNRLEAICKALAVIA